MDVAGTPAHRDIANTYTRVAPIYDAWARITESKSLRLALERAQIRNGENVLEVAVGTGIFFYEILRWNPAGRNVGIDVSNAMLERSQRKAAKLGVPFELSVGDARNLTYEDSSFDVVVNNNMLGLVSEHEIVPILREMKRVLRPGGRLVIVMMIRPRNPIAAGVFRLGAGWLGRWREVRIAPAVGETGFDIVHHETVTQLGFRSEVLIARKSGSVVSHL